MIESGEQKVFRFLFVSIKLFSVFRLSYYLCAVFEFFKGDVRFLNYRFYFFKKL